MLRNLRNKLINYFGQLTIDLSFDCLNEMLRTNIRQTLPAVIRIAQKYSDLLGPTRIIDLLEKYKTAEGLYYYLGGIVNVSEDKDVHFKYIEAATTMGQLDEVQRICRDSRKSCFPPLTGLFPWPIYSTEYNGVRLCRANAQQA